MMIFAPRQDQPIVMTDDDGVRYVDIGDDRVIQCGDQDGESVDSHLNWQLFVIAGYLHTQDCRLRPPSLAHATERACRRVCPGGVECAEQERARYRRELTAVAYAVAHPDVIA